MQEVSTMDAARIIGTSDTTVRKHVNSGTIAARHEGLRGRIRIELDELRKFADEYQYKFDDALASELTK